MEVLTYPHHQLGGSLSANAAAHSLYGVESTKACGNEASAVNPPPYPQDSSINNGVGPIVEEGGASEELRASQFKEEKDSDAGGLNITTKNAKKDKERAQVDYLLSSLPAVNKFFKVHGKIGEGTFSSVFLASLKDIPHGNPLGIHFAIKHLIPTTHPSRAERELKCLQDIGGCDNVVGVHFCLRNHDSIAFIMPYLPHKRFHEYVMDMGVTETRNYMKQLLLALRRVHSFNIIHRDVKPSNFLYDRDTKQFLLVDFGLSQPVEETSKIRPDSSLPEDTRKRKREREPAEDHKSGSYCESHENPAKRPALGLNNSNNIIKTPEKMTKPLVDMDMPYKSVPQVVSSRAKRLQNITNKNCSNAQRSASTSMGVMHLKSPAKDIIESSQGRKTPRKNKNHPNTENMSPPKGEKQSNTKKLSRFDGNEIWRDNMNFSSSNEKQALDLRKVKTDIDSRLPSSTSKPGSRSTRKILFDDAPDANSTANVTLTPRIPLMAHSNQVTPKHLSQASNKAAMLTSSISGAPTVCDPLTLSPVDQTGGLGREFRTLAPENAKDDVAGSSIVRVQNSQVKSQQMSPVTPSESRVLKAPTNQHHNDDKEHKIVFAKPQAPSANGSFHRTNTPSSPHCNCVGRLQVCSVCLSRKPHNAPRAGTPGFRPPEVLLRSPLQSTAVDMWAVGVILLCILSGCYPFFRSPDDLTALAEIMTVFGTDKIKETAKRLGRMVVCSQPSQPLDLKKLCIRMRQRRKDKSNAGSSSSSATTERCQNCCQPLESPENCICLKDKKDILLVNPVDVNNVEEADNVFPDSAYHLLARLLDLDAETRITAAEALDHPFVTG